MKCPTCEDAKDDCCCCCGRPLADDEKELSPNPYTAEIHCDDSPHAMCDSCRHEAAMDI